MHLMSQLGYFIGRYPKMILMTTFLIVTSIISYFIWYPVIIETDMRRGFAHKNGASIREFERFTNFYNVSMYDFEILAIIIISKNDSFMPLKMTIELCEDITRLNDLVTSLSLNSSEYGIIDFNEFKVAKGSINHAFQTFKFVYGIQSALAPNFDRSIILSYPNSFVYGYTLSLAPNIFASKVNERFQEEGHLNDGCIDPDNRVNASSWRDVHGSECTDKDFVRISVHFL
uniref:SSD domain-containing protein n=1 Tax=Ascaris lumbricoides TaxID=6252 RepID=A0A9J2PMT2_ASCLU